MADVVEELAASSAFVGGFELLFAKSHIEGIDYFRVEGEALAGSDDVVNQNMYGCAIAYSVHCGDKQVNRLIITSENGESS